MNSNKHRLYFRASLTIAGALLLASVPLVFAHALSARANTRSNITSYQHVFIIMMENTSYTSLIGNSNAPWINSMATTARLATNYTGVTHPSQPNYIAATSGSTNGVSDDSTVTIDVPNIVDQLEAKGKTWKAYMQSIFAGGNTDKLADSAGDQLYERKHNPFVSYRDVQTNPARMANIMDFSQLQTDLVNNTVPDYVWISPDQCNDMHGRTSLDPTDSCNSIQVQSLIAAGDSFLKTTVNAITSSASWNGNSVIFITWDESDYPFGDTSGCCDAVQGKGGGHVVTLIISHANPSAQISHVAYNHYSMLATIEDGWQLGCLGFTCDTANVPPMSDLVS
jgi:phospholipase C